eukprot:scaffold115728_cov67-Phaeocystis_antarctica.AAC.7
MSRRPSSAARRWWAATAPPSMHTRSRPTGDLTDLRAAPPLDAGSPRPPSPSPSQGVPSPSRGGCDSLSTSRCMRGISRGMRLTREHGERRVDDERGASAALGAEDVERIIKLGVPPLRRWQPLEGGGTEHRCGGSSSGGGGGGKGRECEARLADEDPLPWVAARAPYLRGVAQPRVAEHARACSERQRRHPAGDRAKVADALLVTREPQLALRAVEGEGEPAKVHLGGEGRHEHEHLTELSISSREAERVDLGWPLRRPLRSGGTVGGRRVGQPAIGRMRAR